MSDLRDTLRVPPAALPEWRALAVALAEFGPAPCEGGVLPADFWWSADEHDVELATAACGLCTVRASCLRYAMAASEAEGVWGGMTAADRVSAVAA